jgi:hypothetical protein
MQSLLFICGCLEPGKDGVGDYCRALGGELLNRGWSIGYIAWNDPFVSEVQLNNSGDSVELRLPRQTAIIQRQGAVTEFINQHAFEWVSLQWVGYAFHPKGLPLSFSRWLKTLAACVEKRHLMIHEIWVGNEKDDSLKHKALGYLQRRVLKNAVNNWAPHSVHTQALHYRDQLNQAGISPALLPLFSNIPIVARAERASPRSECPQKTALVFGSIPPAVDYRPFFQQLQRACEQSGDRIEFRCLGRNGEGYTGFRNQVTSFAPELTCKQIGELPVERIQEELLQAGYGVGLARPHLICKSGTAAAFNEFGLPILIARPGALPSELREPPFFRVPLITLDEIGKEAFRASNRLEPKSKLSDIVDLFLKGLRRS